MQKLFVVIAFLASALTHSDAMASIASKSKVAKTSEAKNIVIGWVPAYGIEQSIEAMESQPHTSKGLTHIGLQLWNPSAYGASLVFAPVNKEGKLVQESDVIRLVAWAKQRQIKVLLTVYNNSQVIAQWDWELAKRAFAQHPEQFGEALIAEMQKYQLDGIDLDLEGEGQLDADRQTYAQFVKALSVKLKAQNKLLTIDSFHSPCSNAPNMSWWADWKGQVDAIHSMGYQDLYEGSTDSFTPKGRQVCENGAAIFKYSWQLQYGMKAGYQRHQIVLGVPTWLDRWGKGGKDGLANDVLSHIKEAKKLNAGIALWDLQLQAAQWRTEETWKEIQNLRHNKIEKKH